MMTVSNFQFFGVLIFVSLVSFGCSKPSSPNVVVEVSLESVKHNETLYIKDKTLNARSREEQSMPINSKKDNNFAKTGSYITDAYLGKSKGAENNLSVSDNKHTNKNNSADSKVKTSKLSNLKLRIERPNSDVRSPNKLKLTNGGSKMQQSTNAESKSVKIEIDDSKTPNSKTKKFSSEDKDNKPPKSAEAVSDASNLSTEEPEKLKSEDKIYKKPKLDEAKTEASNLIKAESDKLKPDDKENKMPKSDAAKTEASKTIKAESEYKDSKKPKSDKPEAEAEASKSIKAETKKFKSEDKESKNLKLDEAETEAAKSENLKSEDKKSKRPKTDEAENEAAKSTKLKSKGSKKPKSDIDESETSKSKESDKPDVKGVDDASNKVTGEKNHLEKIDSEKSNKLESKSTKAGKARNNKTESDNTIVPKPSVSQTTKANSKVAENVASDALADVRLKNNLTKTASASSSGGNDKQLDQKPTKQAVIIPVVGMASSSGESETVADNGDTLDKQASGVTGDRVGESKPPLKGQNSKIESPSMDSGDFKKSGNSLRKKASPSKADKTQEDAGSSRFIIYFIASVFIFGVVYIISHKRQKILAFIVEGRRVRNSSGVRSRSGSRRTSTGSGSGGYKPLATDEKAVPSLGEKKPVSVQNFIY